MDRKIIAVMGATGAQGGSLVRAILADPEGGFAVRAVVRDTGSEKARTLANSGAEVVAGDANDPDSLKRAFAGAYGAYCVTFFWAHMSAEKEKAEALAMAQAAKSAGLRHVVWSTLEDTRAYIPLSDNRMPTLQGKYKVPHFDAKGEADKYFAESGIATTYLVTSFYWENLIYFGSGPKKGADGKLSLVLATGDSKLPSVAVEDIGRTAYGIFKGGPAAWGGKRVGVAGEHMTGKEMASALSKALGQEVVYNYVPPEVYRTFGFPGADEMGNMYQFNRDFAEQCCAARDLDVVKQLDPELKSFSEWLSENKNRIPLT